MKFISSIFKLTLMAAMIGAAFSANVNTQAKSLVDAEAINHLRETGDLDALNRAFKTAQTDDTTPSRRPLNLTKFTGSDTVINDQFGIAVAVDGNTALVGTSSVAGATYGRGVVYVFVKNGTMWTQQQKLIGSDATSSSGFATSLAISGDTAIIGARSSKVGANANQGAAYVFTRSGTVWTQTQKLTASDGGPALQFSNSVAMSGDTAIIGSWTNHNNFQANNIGSAYVFTKSGGVWTEIQKLTASDGAQNFHFGISIAISGNTAIIGAYRATSGATPIAGAAYIFTRSGSTWTEQQKLTASDPAQDDRFGWHVAISGDTAVVGAYWKNFGVAHQGAAYVYVRSGSTWTQQQRLTYVDGSTGGNQFGYTVGISGDRVVVGAFQDDIVPNDNRGSAHVYVRSGTTWTYQERLTPLDSDTGADYYGESLAISGDTILIGAKYNNAGAGFGQGAVYSYNFNNRRSQFDFDGDGRADLAVYRPLNNVWYVDQSQNGFAGVQFGAAGDVPISADYDGDGRTDMAVYRPSNGTWYVQRTLRGYTGFYWGIAEDIPMPADFDGDGKADFAIYRPSNGTWYIQRSRMGYFTLTQGSAGDKPIAADFDGDGKADVGVFRPSNGTWYMQQTTAGATSVQFGATDDKPVAGDYDGDGKADVAVFRPSNGVWYMLQSTAGFTGTAFGYGTDLPVPADYDGDGKTDVAVFRPENGVWYLNRSTEGFTGVAFGVAIDKPVPNNFVQ